MSFKMMIFSLLAATSLNSFAQWDVINDFVGLNHKEVRYYFHSGARNLADLEQFNKQLLNSSKARSNAISESKSNFRKALNVLDLDIKKFESRYPNNKNLGMFFDSLYDAAEDLARNEMRIIARVEALVRDLQSSYAAKIKKTVSLDSDMRDIYWRGERVLTGKIKTTLKELENALIHVMKKDGDFSRYQKYDNLEIFSYFLSSQRGSMIGRMGQYMKNLPPILRYRKDVVKDYGRLIGNGHPQYVPSILFNLKMDKACFKNRNFGGIELWKLLNFRVFDQVFKFYETDMEMAIDAVAAIMKNDSVRVICKDVWSKSSVKTVYSRRDNTIYVNYQYKPVQNCTGGGCRSPYIIAPRLQIR